jgi:DNA-directed RNA polymerase subunit RPC12/RpoP
MLLFHEELTNMKIRAELPPAVHGLRYVTNSHFLELEDDKGHTTRMLPRSFCKYVCSKCQVVFFMTSNFGAVRCPCCGDASTVKSAWGSFQIGFMPEEESEFQGMICDDAEKDG